MNGYPARDPISILPDYGEDSDVVYQCAQTANSQAASSDPPRTSVYPSNLPIPNLFGAYPPLLVDPKTLNRLPEDRTAPSSRERCNASSASTDGRALSPNADMQNISLLKSPNSGCVATQELPDIASPTNDDLQRNAESLVSTRGRPAPDYKALYLAIRNKERVADCRKQKAQTREKVEREDGLEYTRAQNLRMD